jgi:hypothetical protein
LAGAPLTGHDAGVPSAPPPETARTPAGPAPAPTGAERDRLAAADRREARWRHWGPYLSERAWGTVREDYSPDGEAWTSFPFEQAHARAYRWNEDGMAGICDLEQHLCLGLALWNGRDPILKERAYGLTGAQGNHGEDVKDCWWYLDATPSSSWLRWRYHYPQAAFPYDDLRTTNAARSRLDPEYELLDTGVFDEDRYWVVDVTWAKAGPDDLCWRIQVTNKGLDTAEIDVLPTAWFRNTWSWGGDTPRPSAVAEPGPEGQARILLTTTAGERFRLTAQGSPPGASRAGGRSSGPEALFCDNETDLSGLWGVPGPAYPKDGIGRHVIAGEASVNPAATGTKAALRHHLVVEPGGTAEIRLRFATVPAASAGPTDDFDAVLAAREVEADAFHDALAPADAGADERLVLRQAAAGMLWSKQFYHYDLERWLDGDPGQPAPPPQRRQGRNAEWPHLSNHDVISMPDPWEYPWYAAWDLAFHCVALAHLDAEFAKRQLILLGREWYMHPNGQLPAYEWNLSDVNPPVQAWAALRVADIDHRRRLRDDPDATVDHAFLERVFHKLMLNFTWWVNRKDLAGNNVFEGGFLGLDNIGLFDRSKPLPVAGYLEQSDGTAWMAMFSLNMLDIALRLAHVDPVYEDVATKFFEHFTYVARAMEDQGLWDEADGFFYDVMALDDGQRLPVRVCSMVGVVAVFAVTTLRHATLTALPDFAARFRWFVDHKPADACHVGPVNEAGSVLLSVIEPEKLRRVLGHCLDPAELLSDHGLRSLSARQREAYSLTVEGVEVGSIDYEPAESTNYLFGGNSNWRGPVWFPLNHLFVEALRTHASYEGDGFRVEHPVGSGHQAALTEVADDLSRRLVSIFLPDAAGRRPVSGRYGRLDTDPAWSGQMWFHEYFHGDTGAGLGASHQTGWTGLVVDLIAGRADRSG